MGVKVAVFGTTGAVGREMLTILEERLFPADEIHALARPVIEDAEYDKGVVRLSVRYSADLVSHISGAGAEENASAPVRSRDLWTFERHVQSDSPNWLLVATQTE